MGQRSEHDELVPAFMHLMRAIDALVADADMLSQAAVAGKLDDPGRCHQACKASIASWSKGFNATLDAVIGPLKVAAKYVDRISKGDLPPQITDRYNGDFNAIKNNLNECIASLTGLMEEIRHMSHEHDLGDIDVMIDAEQVQRRLSGGCPRDQPDGRRPHQRQEEGDGLHRRVRQRQLRRAAGEVPRQEGLHQRQHRAAALKSEEVHRRDDPHVATPHNAGDIDAVIPVEDFEGAYRTMANGVNDMVGGHISVKKKAMACIAEFGKGNFEAPLEKFPARKPSSTTPSNRCART